MSTSPEFGSPDYFPAIHDPVSAPHYAEKGGVGYSWKPMDDDREVTEFIDHFEAQIHVREQDSEGLGQLVVILRDTWKNFAEDKINAQQVLSAMAQLKTDEIKTRFPDEITQAALQSAVEKIEAEANRQ